MLPAPLSYARPSSLEDALARLSDGRPAARVLAGGQTLVNALKLRLARVDLLVDISGLDELRGVAVDSDGTLEIGAAVTYDELGRDAAVGEAQPFVAKVADGLVDQQVRCRGTIGGNCCFNDPASNYPPLLVALGATMRLRSATGSRAVGAEEFFVAPFETALQPGEILRSVIVPPLSDGDGIGYQSLQIASDSWAFARAAARVRCVDGRIDDVRVVLGCVDGAPLRARATEDALSGAPATAERVGEAAAAAADGVEAVSDAHASGEYRRQMARIVARRAVIEAIGGGA